MVAHDFLYTVRMGFADGVVAEANAVAPFESVADLLFGKPA